MRRFGVGALVAAAVVAAFLWWSRGHEGQRPSDDVKTVPAGRVVGDVPGATPALAAPAWLGQPGRAPRRIAGRVLADGVPVANASVKLLARPVGAPWLLRDLATDAAGRFDFGPLPAAPYEVSAHAAGRRATLVALDLRLRSPRPVPESLELALPPCTDLVFGTVRDPSGGIIAAARIRSLEAGLAETRTDDKGAYTICVPSEHGYIEAAAEGYGARSEHIAARRRTRLDLLLMPEVVIAGRVVTAPDLGAAGASVTLELTSGEHVAQPGKVLTTDEDGRFRAVGLSAGLYRVQARLGGRMARSDVRVTRAGEVLEDVLLMLEREIRLGGVVLAGEAPVANATVAAVPAAGDPGRNGGALWSAVTGADGRFAIALSSGGALRLTVDGHEVLAPRAIDAQPRDDLVVRVKPLASVAGKVVRGGKTIAGATVGARPAGGFRRGTSSVTLPDGTFDLRGLPPDDYELWAEHGDSGAMAATRKLTLGEGQRIEGLVIELDLAASIAGVVVDHTGAPVAGAAVRFTCPSPRDYGADVTADDGSFEATAMAGGCDYEVQVKRAAAGEVLFPASETRFAPIAVKDGATHVEGVRLVVKLEDLRIAGKVIRGGQPVADVTVAATNVAGGPSPDPAGRVITGVDGAFELSRLSPGRHVLTATLRDGFSDETQVMAGEMDVRFELPELGSIAGSVEGFASLERVLLSSAGQLANAPIAARVSDRSFEVDDVPVGRYQAVAAGGSEVATAAVTVEAGRVSRVTLRGKGSAKLRGVVHDLRGGGPVEGLVCRWSGAATATQPAIGEATQVAITDATGHFQLDVPAAMHLRVDCDSGDPRDRTFSDPVIAEPGASMTIDLFAWRLRSREFGATPLSIDGWGVVGAMSHAGTDFKVGDRLLRIDGLALPPTNPQRLFQIILGDHPPGVAYSVVVLRDGAEITLQITNGEYPRRPAGN